VKTSNMADRDGFVRLALAGAIASAEQHGKAHVFEVKNNSGRLTQGQAMTGVFDMKKTSNIGGKISAENGITGSFSVATGNKSKNSAMGTSRGEVVPNVRFHVLRYSD